MAIKFLERGDLSIPELARRLGFTDAATFRRAFKEWTGQAPASFRKEGALNLHEAHGDPSWSVPISKAIYSEARARGFHA
jgi:AraC-like DNA-binding protein